MRVQNKSWAAFQFIKVLFVIRKMRVQTKRGLLLDYSATFVIRKRVLKTSGWLLLNLLIISIYHTPKMLILRIL